MLTNSLIAGALGAAYLTVLVLQLNPQVPIASDTTWRWFTTLGMLYGLHLAVIFYLVIVFAEFFAFGSLSPAWASVRVLGWLAAATAAVAATLMWLNVHGFHAALSDEAARRMTNGAIATSASAIVLLAIAIARYSVGGRGSRLVGTVFVLAAIASLVLPLAARGAAVPAPGVPSRMPRPHERQDGPRVRLVLLDGASLEYILPHVAEGRLPNFGRLLDKGARMDLATIRPTQPEPVWAAVATGMYPARSGVRSAGAYYARNDSRGIDLLPDYCLSHALVRLGFIRAEPNASDRWRARPLWSILADFGITAGIVRWPLTYPAPDADGFVVSDRFHQLVESFADFDRAASPPQVLPVLQKSFQNTVLSSRGLAYATTAALAARPPEAAALERDRLYSLALHELDDEGPRRLTALRYDGLDTVGHYYWKYTQPGGVREEDSRRFAQVVDHYYTYIDDELGETMAALDAGDLLVVVSGFGMQGLSPLKRGIGRVLGDPDFSGTHERAPDGFLLAFGAPVEPGRHQRGSIVDVTPTLLYFLGLPIARDLDGYARADLFNRAFTAERPIVFIPTYGS
jgi:Type I phosphodiesterase / nucleotide pyrophosphatase